MKIAVLSGKGGAGKTFISVNLAYSIGNAAYVDCDVEEPNGALFLKPQNIREVSVSQWIPSFDPIKCTGCRECVKHCRFNALICIRKKPMVFPEVCHSCGLCTMVCPENAISEEPRPLGHLEIGQSGSVKVITGVLNPGVQVRYSQFIAITFSPAHIHTHQHRRPVLTFSTTGT